MTLQDKGERNLNIAEFLDSEDTNDTNEIARAKRIAYRLSETLKEI